MNKINIIKANERQEIILMCDDNNKKYIQIIIKDDKRDVYKTIQNINHPNIPKILNVEFDGNTVITEEYISGQSLSALIDEKKIKKKQIQSIALQLISAVNVLHESNIIHRDIKPDNIIINDTGHIWLIDYDIARIYRPEIRQDTEVAGTFGYAPIEQYGMLPTDFKTDIYAFGTTLMQLLDCCGKKGSLYNIAKKCKRLDPSQRYENSKKLERAIKLRFFKNPLLYITVPALISAVCVSILYKPPKEAEQTVSTNIESTAPAVEEDASFYDFNDYSEYVKLRDYPTFGEAAIFSADEPWEHLLFVDDVNLSGKIKLGKNNTLVNADIALIDGELSVNLSDKNGNEFSHKFKYDNQYDYEKKYTDNLRKNADIICRDMDYDKVPELLIGLNEGAMGVVEHQFYNHFNYSVGWCIKYDEQTGFVLCDGDMFSKGSDFRLTKFNNQITVPWESAGDIMGYKLENNKIMPI